MFWDAVQGGRARMAGAVLFGGFDFFPVGPDFVHVFDFEVAEDMRMAANEFFGDAPGYLLEIKRAALAGQLAVENHLQQQIAQFLGHFLIVARLDRVHQFVDFLDGVKAEGHVVLLAVPGAALRGTEPGHDSQKIVEGGFCFHGDGLLR